MNSTNSRIYFSYRAGLATPEGETYTYLLRSSIWGEHHGKLMANQAITAFYLPYARLDKPQLAKETAKYAISMLEAQALKLRHEFGLDGPPSLTSSSPSLPITPEDHNNGAQLFQDSLYGDFDIFE